MEPIENAICEVTQMIFSAMLGLDVYPADPGGGADAVGQRSVAGSVQISGAWEGAVTVHCAAALASEMAAILFDIPAERASRSEACDAVAELANMAGGNLKALMPEPSRASLPAVVEGTDLATSLPGSRLVGSVRFECRGHPIEVSLFERDACCRSERGA